MSRSITRQSFDSAALVARLDIPADRSELVRETLESTYALIDKLDDLELGETPPASAFNARWE